MILICATLWKSLCTSCQTARHVVDSSWTAKLGKPSSQSRGVVASQKSFAIIQSIATAGMSCPWSGLARFNNKPELWPTLALLSDGAIRALALSCQEHPEDRLSELLEKFQEVDTLFQESRKSYLNKVVAWLVWGGPIVWRQSFSPWSCLWWSGQLLLERH